MSQVNLDPIVHDDLEPLSVPVRFRGEDYTLIEVDEGGAVKFNSARVSAARFQDGELDRVEKSAEVEPLLVSLCLKAKGGVAVSIETIKRWPARFVKQLYDKAIEISGLDEVKTVAQLDREISRLTKKRDKLVKEEGSPKAQPSSTDDTSS